MVSCRGRRRSTANTRATKAANRQESYCGGVLRLLREITEEHGVVELCSGHRKFQDYTNSEVAGWRLPIGSTGESRLGQSSRD
jgi:hypothetical protein